MQAHSVRIGLRSAHLPLQQAEAFSAAPQLLLVPPAASGVLEIQTTTLLVEACSARRSQLLEAEAEAEAYSAVLLLQIPDSA